MSSRRLLTVILTLLLAAACKGGIDGAVYGTDGEQPVPVTDHAVYLLPASAEIASVLKSACPAEAADWKQRAESERGRLSDMARLYADSAHRVRCSAGVVVPRPDATAGNPMSRAIVHIATIRTSLTALRSE
jgi:hypothetical protein